MATLLLTAAGTALAGPLGGAIGAIAGNAIDHRLFAPAGRDGPRLADLAVQTSAYGTPLPLQFGTMRIAGTVIWATDLIESRSTSRASKSSPAVASYSYAASFAVALSGRPIADVGRIWADGTLLRGAAGDFKTATGFRLHTGDEDQPPDPLIAAAEGLALAPAHRGLAYAVFEDFQLADYGNRIPSLTFEVIADTAAIGAIAAALAPGAVTGAAAATLGGFSAYGSDRRPVLDTLADAAGGWYAPEGDGYRLVTGGASVAIDDAGFAAAGMAARAARSIAALAGVPASLAVAHYDPARDYQTGVQRARRPGPGAAEKRLDLPAAIDAQAAQRIAAAALARAEAARETRQVRLSVADLAVAPGSVVTIAGEAGNWRVAGWSLEGMVLSLDLVRLSAASVAPLAASAGRVVAAPDRPVGATLLHLFELPPLDDTLLAAPRLFVAACGTGAGWRAAGLLASLDGGASWQPAGGTAAPATIGTVAIAPLATGAALADRRSVIEVMLAHDDMTLADADDDAMDSGANLALVGDELLQFGRAVPLGSGRWRLTGLWRGRRGTEAAIGSQSPGDRFVLIEREALLPLDLSPAALGTTLRVRANGVGDAAPVDARAAVTGVSVVPPAPVHARRDGDVLGWVRRSRLGWHWTDGGDVPLGEEAERYRITLTSAGGTHAVVEVTETRLPLPAADAPIVATIVQLGTLGASPATLVPLEPSR